MWRHGVLLSLFAVGTFLIGCGGDGSPKKGPFTTNAMTNNATTNNATTNNATTNNATTNNVMTGNNTTPGSVCVEVVNETIDFGTVQTGVTATREPVIRNCSDTAELFVTPSLTGDEAFSIVAANEVRIRPGESAKFIVEFRPQSSATQSATLTYTLADYMLEFTSSLSGRGTMGDDDCPIAEARVRRDGAATWDSQLVVEPGTRVELDGDPSADASGDTSMIAQWDWSIVDSPVGSSATLSSNIGERVTFTPDLMGQYRVALSVTDFEGITSCTDSEVILTVGDLTDQPGITVELVWTTPLDQDLTDDSGTDLDLHLLHPSGQWNTPPFDVFWDNPDPDWGPIGDPGNPELALDDNNGAGPEIIRLAEPVDGLTYSVGVYYYNENSFGASYATVRVYFDGVLETELKDVFLRDRADFLLSHRIAWLVGDRSVTSVDMVSNGFP